MGTTTGSSFPELQRSSPENRLQHAKKRRRDGLLNVSSIDSILLASCNQQKHVSDEPKICSQIRDHHDHGDKLTNPKSELGALPFESKPIRQRESRGDPSLEDSRDKDIARSSRRLNTRNMSSSSAKSMPEYGTKGVKSRPNSIRSLPLGLREQNIDHILAFHQRSCSIFNESRSHTVPPSTRSSSLASSVDDKDTSSTSTSPSYVERRRRSESTESLISEPQNGRDDVLPTIIHWNSDATRLREYAEIEKYAKGFHRIFRRFGPKWCYRNIRQPFYDSARSSEAGSVRRYKLDVSDSIEELRKSSDSQRKLEGKRGLRWLNLTVKSPFKVLSK